MSILQRMLPGCTGRRCVDFVGALLRKASRKWTLRRRDVALRNRGRFFRILQAHLEPLEPRLALANGFINTNGTPIAGCFNGGPGTFHDARVDVVTEDPDFNGLVNTSSLRIRGTIDGPNSSGPGSAHASLRLDALDPDDGNRILAQEFTFSLDGDSLGQFDLIVPLRSGDGSRRIDLQISRDPPSTLVPRQFAIFKQGTASACSSTNLRGTFTVDTARPTVTIAKLGAQSDPTNASPIRFTVQFNGTVTDFNDASDVSFTGSTAPGTLAAAITSVSGSLYTVSVSGMTGSGTVVASIPQDVAIDSANNGNTASSTATVTYDVTAPTVTINQMAGQADPATTAPVRFSVQFNGPVSDFDDAGDVSFAGSTAPGTLLASIVSVSSSLYTVSVSGMTGSGAVVATIPASRAIDAAGNGNTASTSTDNGVAFNFDSSAPMADIVDIAPDPRATSVSSVTINFTEAVVGFDLSDVRLTRNGGLNLLTGGQSLTTGDSIAWTLGNLAGLTGSGGEYSLTLIAGGSGITDATGNPLVADASDTWRFSSPPMITPIGDQFTLEDVATTAIAFTISDNATAANDLLLSASSSDENLVPIANIAFSGTGGGREVIVTPGADLSGTVTITITVEDADHELFVESFELTVEAVNDPPRFVAGLNKSATDEDPENVSPAWATGISKGSADESGQLLEFLVENDANGLFKVQPAIDSAGQLTFTPAPNAHGTAQVTVRLMDNGGVADGGDDTSAPQMFEIVITKPFAKHNTLRRLDVQPDEQVVAGDALDVINFLNAFGSGRIPEEEAAGPPYYDTTGDDFLAPDDALDVINFLNAFGSGLPGPEGEGAGEATAAGEAIAAFAGANDQAADDLAAIIDFIAGEASGEQSRRRRARTI